MFNKLHKLFYIIIHRQRGNVTSYNFFHFLNFLGFYQKITFITTRKHFHLLIIFIIFIIFFIDFYPSHPFYPLLSISKINVWYILGFTLQNNACFNFSSMSTFTKICGGQCWIQSDPQTYSI